MEYIVVVALVVVAFFVGISRFKKKEGDDEVFSRKAFNKKWEEVKALEEEVPQEEKDIAYIVDEKKIPFKSPFEYEKKIEIATEIDIALPTLVFQGMVWNSVRPQVIINNKVYDVDDAIEVGLDKAKIKDITKDGVHLRYKGKDFIVKPR
ncbi:hypothetical protein ACFL28_00900 [Candidatus Omnitrophota bacterium]